MVNRVEEILEELGDLGIISREYSEVIEHNFDDIFSALEKDNLGEALRVTDLLESRAISLLQYCAAVRITIHNAKKQTNIQHTSNQKPLMRVNSHQLGISMLCRFNSSLNSSLFKPSSLLASATFQLYFSKTRLSSSVSTLLIVL